jgi:hypothetical protein
MNLNFRSFASVTAGLILAAASASAMAQDKPAGAPPAHQAWKAHAKEHEQARIQALHDLLQIRPDQEAAFQTFTASMHPDKGEGPHEGWGKPGAMQHLTTPQRLDRMSARLAKMQAHIEAVKTFYAVLSPQQQKAFDVLPRAGMGGHEWGRGGHHKWGGEGHPMGPHGPQGAWGHHGPGGQTPPPPPPKQ